MRRLYIILMVLSTFSAFAQDEKLEWISFPELEMALSKAPKKTLVHFYADWCAYCKKMEKAVYNKQDIIVELKTNYYPVKFNVESKDSVVFGGKIFVNRDAGKKRRAYHQIAQLLAGQKNKSLELPAIVILDKNFRIEKRFFRYIPPKEMLSILKN